MVITACAGGVEQTVSSSVELPEGATPEGTFDIAQPDPGDATDDELDLIFLVIAASIQGNEIDMAEVFTIDGEFATGSRGRFTGREEIGGFLRRGVQVGWYGDPGDFTRIGSRLVFNWSYNKRSGELTNQGVETMFDQGRIAILDVSSPAVPYCLGTTDSGCKDFRTGEVIPASS